MAACDFVHMFDMYRLQWCIDSGFYPRGGGEVTVEASPVSSLRPVELLDRGNIVQVTGRAFVAGTLPVRVSVSSMYVSMPPVGWLVRVGLVYSLCLWHCWLGLLTCKTVSHITYNLHSTCAGREILSPLPAATEARRENHSQTQKT